MPGQQGVAAQRPDERTHRPKVRFVQRPRIEAATPEVSPRPTPKGIRTRWGIPAHSDEPNSSPVATWRYSVRRRRHDRGAHPSSHAVDRGQVSVFGGFAGLVGGATGGVYRLLGAARRAGPLDPDGPASSLARFSFWLSR